MMQFFALARATGVVEIREGIQLVSSGIDFSPFNSAMLAEPLTGLQYSDFEQRFEMASSFFRDRRERWSFWLCDDILPHTARRQAKALLLNQGMRQTSEPPGMFAEAVSLPERPLPPHFTFEQVHDDRTRNDFSGLTACNFDLPFSICREIYQNERSWAGPVQGWVGYLRGEPITTCAIVVHNGIIGVYTVGTLSNFRKQGFGEALMRHALLDTSRRTGIERTILQATPAGYPMYNKMGYRKVCQFSIFLSEH